MQQKAPAWQTSLFNGFKHKLSHQTAWFMKGAHQRMDHTWVRSPNSAVHVASSTYASVLDGVLSRTLSLTWSPLTASLPMHSSPSQWWVLPCCNRDIAPFFLSFFFVSLRFSLARRQCPFLGTFWKGVNTKQHTSSSSHSSFHRSSWTNANL